MTLIYFELQSTFMLSKNEQLDTLQDIKQMMERSSRFISLSGWSGIAAGVCALAGAAWAYSVIGPRADWRGATGKSPHLIDYTSSVPLRDYMGSKLFLIAVFTFMAAF